MIKKKFFLKQKTKKQLNGHPKNIKFSAFKNHLKVVYFYFIINFLFCKEQMNEQGRFLLQNTDT